MRAYWSYGLATFVTSALALAMLPAAGHAAFNEETAAAITGVYNCAAAWGDYDNDGDVDLAICGQDTTNARVTRIYRNDGGGVFADTNAGLVGVEMGALAWGDYDRDGDLDLVVTGSTDAIGTGSTRVYRNNGGSFVDAGVGIQGVFESAVAWGDYDGDGDLDLAIAGRTGYG